MNIKEYHAPTVQLSVTPTTIQLGGTAQLNATANGSECGGATGIQYAASEGTTSGTMRHRDHIVALS